MIALGEAAQEHGRVLVFLIDEIQHRATHELSALVMAEHQVNQRVLPVVFAGAGLPQVPTLTAEARTYAERMSSWPELGPLPDSEARSALLLPARAAGCAIDPAALDFIVDYTQGYPYFLQEYGKAVWNVAERSPITAAGRPAEELVEALFDQDFFALRVGGLPARELQHVKALAGLGTGGHTPADVARAMGADSSAKIGAFSRRLTDKGLTHRSRRGRVAFTGPQFDRYIDRAY